MSEEKKSMAKDSTARAGLRRWLPEVTAKKKKEEIVTLPEQRELRKLDTYPSILATCG